MAAHELATPEPVNAAKERYDEAAALELASAAQHVWAAKGKSQTKLKVSDATDEELAKALLGPSKKLRAPTMRVGNRLIVGFQEDLYCEVFKL